MALFYTEQFHSDSVNKICRLCLKMVKNQKQARLFKKDYLVNDFKSFIFQVHGLNVGEDVPGTHSAYFCRPCKLKLDSYVKRNITLTRNEELDNIWLAYNNTSALCDVCLHHQALTAGGRFKPPSRPSPVLKEVSEHIQIVFAL